MARSVPTRFARRGHASRGIDCSAEPSVHYRGAVTDLEYAPCPSRRSCPASFYEKFGDELTNELVEWFNQVDATYKLELRELNELNFARLEAKLAGAFDRMDARMAAFEARIIRWMFIFWVGTLGTVIALMKL
jgi:hypothetical protein